MRDTDFGGVYAPSILVIFLVTLAVVWVLDHVVAKTGFYDRVWHPALFRTGLFACVFAGVDLCFYR